QDEDVVLTHIDGNQATLNWTPALDDVWVQHYHIYEGDGENEDQLIAVVPGDRTNHQLEGLEVGEEYTYTIKAGDASGKWSENNPNITFKAGDTSYETDDEDWFAFQEHADTITEAHPTVLRGAANRIRAAIHFIKAGLNMTSLADLGMNMAPEVHEMMELSDWLGEQECLSPQQENRLDDAIQEHLATLILDLVAKGLIDLGSVVAL